MSRLAYRVISVLHTSEISDDQHEKLADKFGIGLKPEPSELEKRGFYLYATPRQLYDMTDRDQEVESERVFDGINSILGPEAKVTVSFEYDNDSVKCAICGKITDRHRLYECDLCGKMVCRDCQDREIYLHDKERTLCKECEEKVNDLFKKILKPCPFCGNDAEISDAPEHYIYEVECSCRSAKHPIVVGGDSICEAIHAWNDRPVTEHEICQHFQKEYNRKKRQGDL